MKSTKPDLGKILLGVVLVIIGILILVENLGVDMKPVWEFIFKFWPLIFIYIGVKKIISSKEDEEKKPQKENPTPTSP